jgi:hypothetical protein
VSSHLAVEANSQLEQGSEALMISAVAARGLDALLAAVWKALGIS